MCLFPCVYDIVWSSEQASWKLLVLCVFYNQGPLCYQEKVIAALSVCVPQFRASESVLARIRDLLSRSRSDAEHYFEEFRICDSHYLY